MKKIAVVPARIFAWIKKFTEYAWAIFSSPGMLWLASLFFLFTYLVVTFWPQLPFALASNPAEKVTWLQDHTRSILWAGLWRPLRFFDLQHALWWRSSVLIIGFIFWIRLGDAMRLLLWPRFNRSHVPPLTRTAAAVPAQQSHFPASEGITEADTLAMDTMHRCGIIAGLETVGPARQVFAYGPLAGLRAYLLIAIGGLLLVGGLLTNSYLSWALPFHPLSAGQQWTEKQHNFQVQLNAIRDSRDGYPAASMAITRGQSVDQEAIPLGHATTIGDLRFAFVDAWPHLQITAIGAKGALLPMQTVNGQVKEKADLSFAASGTERNLLLSATTLALRIVGYKSLPEKGFTGPVFLVQVYKIDGEQPIASQFVDHDGAIRINDALTLRFAIQREMILAVNSEPGRWLVLAGLMLSMIGTLAAFLWPLRRCWAQYWVTDRQIFFRRWGEQCKLWYCHPWYPPGNSDT